MDNVFFIWWRGKGHNQFTTLHLSRRGASQFRQANKKKWKSKPDRSILSTQVSEKEFQRIKEKLAGRTGMRDYLQST